VLKIIDLFVVIGILVSVSLLGDRLAVDMGGSVALLILIPVFYYISYVEKRAQFEMSLLSLMLLLFFCVNYLNYLFVFELYQKNLIVLSYCVLHALIVLVLGLIMLRGLNLSRDENRSDMVVVVRQNYKFIVLSNLMLSLCYAIVTCLVFLSVLRSNKLTGDLFKMIPVSFAWFPIFLVALNFALKKVKYECLDCVVKKDEMRLYSGFDLKKVYFGIMFIIFASGTLVELARNEWLLWIEVFISINLSIGLFWKTYRPRISINQCNILTDNESVNSLINPKTFFLMVCLNTVIMTTFIVGLIVFLIVL
jgi:hypothetical protein